MAKNINNLNSIMATHPGEVLRDELEARGIKQKDFAVEIDIAITQLNEVLKGKRSVTSDFAVLLESALGIDAKFWVNMQANYNLDVAKIKESNVLKTQVLERWQVLKKYVAINYFKRVGIIQGNPFIDEKIIQLIYKTTDIEGIINQVDYYDYAFFKKSEKLKTHQVNLVSWIKLIEHKASSLTVENFNASKYDMLLLELREIFNQTNVVQKASKALARCGIKLVVLENPEHVPVDGMSFWSGNNPSIGLTLRHSRLDNFAFTLFHELGHILLHLENDKKIEFIDNMDDTIISIDRTESEANEFATDNLIDPSIWRDMITTCFNYTDGVIENFAQKANIHPAILRGKVCYEFNQYYKSKTRISNQLK